jgi:hypothetical protein
MGLTYRDARRLLEARYSGVSFERTLTFGRLKLFLHPGEVRSLCKIYSAHTNGNGGQPPLSGYTFGQYADTFWTAFLGAQEVHTLDYSDYEGATWIHDMNQPVAESLHNRFDAVIEAGSLEHVFNFPVAIRNLMLMAKPGGSVFITTVANNLCGHGFYQFSPELMYRIFTPENGFELPRVVLLEGVYPGVELRPIRAAYQVADPASVAERVGLQCSRPVMMMVDAKKARACTPFEQFPQQSDYVVAWQKSASQDRGRIHRILEALPPWCQREIRGYRQKRKSSLQNRRFFRKLA